MFDLSICVITWNRSKQLKEALVSCLHCVLPDKTQFIIVDNASTDNTEEVVRSVLGPSGYSYLYKKMESNLGVGGGRNVCYQLASSKYSYYLDDDAVIDSSCYDTFFKYPIELFERYANVATITTKIKDRMLEEDRQPIIARSWMVGGFPCILMYYGGSHFLRNNVFKDRVSLYDEIKYGHEELSPSLFVMAKGYRNIYVDALSIEHRPAVDKWGKSSAVLKDISLNCINNQYLTKSILYPFFFRPMVFLAYKLRMYKHLHSLRAGKAFGSVQILIKNTSKLTCTQVLCLFSQFGFKIF